MARTNPGIHSIQVGDITVTALNDGQFEASLDLVLNLPREEAETLLHDSFRVVPPRISVSCFLLEWPDRRVIVDFGAGGAYGSALGHAHKRLAALGVAPDSVDAVLLTHGHPDHLGGLLDAGGGAFFPKATLHADTVEAAFWNDSANQGPFPDLARKVFAAYGSTLHLFEGEATVLPGVTAVPLPGHTAGHTGFMIQSGSESLFVFADIVHLPGIQFAAPQAGIGFDGDPATAAASRARALDMAAADRLLVAGIHLDFPIFGHVARHGSGYAIEPVVWAPSSAGLPD